ncbi:hypothetical protein [Methylobacterium sp. A54F]
MGRDGEAGGEGSGGPDRASNAGDARRAERLKAALRDNLRRRKAQARQRAQGEGSGEASGEAAPETPKNAP